MAALMGPNSRSNVVVFVSVCATRVTSLSLSDVNCCAIICKLLESIYVIYPAFKRGREIETFLSPDGRGMLDIVQRGLSVAVCSRLWE
jgi:hypothetical protein